MTMKNKSVPLHSTGAPPRGGRVWSFSGCRDSIPFRDWMQSFFFKLNVFSSQAAVSLGTMIMTVEWVRKCWERRHEL